MNFFGDGAEVDVCEGGEWRAVGLVKWVHESHEIVSFF